MTKILPPSDGSDEAGIALAPAQIGEHVLISVGGFRGLVLGSVSRGISKAASCSTLVVAHRGPSAHDRGRGPVPEGAARG